MLARLVTVRPIDQPAVAIGPLVKVVKVARVHDPGHNRVIDVPVDADAAPDLVGRRVRTTASEYEYGCGYLKKKN